MKRIQIVIFLIFITLNKLFAQDVKIYHSLQEAFSDSTNVKSLDLSENNLVELPVEILHLKNLEDIDLEANPNLNLGEALHLLSQLKHLKSLGLGRNKLSDIPTYIAALKNLDDLSLEDNEFTDIPATIKKLHIKSLFLYGDKMETLHLKKGDLADLTDINLCVNKFTIFPTQLSVLPNLKQITIWHNKIRFIPRAISQFKQLDSLELDNNELSKLPPEIALLKKLHHLSIRFNHLKSQDIKEVYRITSLTGLDLEGNNIEIISTRIGNLKNLKYFNISDNPITELPFEFSNLQKLQILGLNNLHDLDWAHAFKLLQKLPKLTALGISGMGLRKMPEGFEELRQVKSFWITNNSFDKEEWTRIKKLLPNAKFE